MFQMTPVPFDAQLAQELAQREEFLSRTREARIAAAQQVLRECFPPTVLRRINVMVPYRTFEGATRYRKIPTLKKVAPL